MIKQIGRERHHKNQIITREHPKPSPPRIKSTLDLSEAIRDADFVIEAVKEDINLKKNRYSKNLTNSAQST